MSFFRREPDPGADERFFGRDRQGLVEMVVRMGALVRENLESAVRGLTERDEAAALAGASGDDGVDEMEVQVEQECLRLLALRQPVREDLRFVFAVLRIVKDLERMGDEAENVAEEALRLFPDPVPLPLEGPLRRMGELCFEMVDDALDALVRGDAPLAERVVRRDDDVDALWFQVREDTVRLLGTCPPEGESGARRTLTELSAARHLERVGDHATNVAELAFFVLTGKRLREERPAPPPAPEA